MTYPTKYTRQYDFLAFSNANPTRPHSGQKINVDYDAVEQSIDEIVEFLKLHTRSDGQIANGVVGRDQLSSDILTLIDAANGNAVAAANVTYDNSGTAIAATSVQEAIDEVYAAITAGGITDIVQDTSPQLGGDLDLNGHVITGLEIGVNVQAYDADLTTWAGLTPSANAQSLVTAADYAAMVVLLEPAIEAAIDTLANLTSVQGLTVTLADAGADALFGWDDSASAYQNLSAADVRTALGLVIGTNVQAYDADLTTWAGLTPSANAQSLVTAADYAAMRALLDLEAGTDFYSKSAADAAFQPLDGDLTTIAGLTATSDNFLQAKSSAWASRTPTQVTADLINFVGDSGSGGTKGLVPAPAAGDAAAAKFLKADGTWGAIAGGGDMLKTDNLSGLANYGTARTNMGLAIGTDVQAYDATLLSIAALGTAADKIAYTTGIDTWAETALTAAARSILDDTTVAAIATTLGLGTGDSPQFTAVNVGHATDTTITRVSAGVIAVEGSNVLLASGLGSTTQAYDADLAALAANSTDGFWAHTGAGTGSARTLTAPAAGFTITNPAGIAGNPTFVLANDLAALEAMASTGIVARTASETYAQRTITASNGVSITNGDGVAGAPAITGTTATTAAYGVVKLATEVRELLTAARTYYVRTDGSNSNTGLANTSGGAFLTLQKAYDVIVGTLDLGGQTVTITQGTAGTLTGALAISVSPTGGQTIVLDLGGGTLNVTSARAINVTAPIKLTVQNGTLQTTTSGDTVYAGVPGANITIGASITFGAAPGSRHMFADNNGNVSVGASYSVTGAASYHLVATLGGILTANSMTCTLSGTLAFTVFAYVDTLGSIQSFPGSFTGGTITGQRYNASTNGIIYTFGSGANYFPGNSAGATATGGQYG